MKLVQLLLPLFDNAGRAFPRRMFDTVRVELTRQFGGVTAYVRSPAVGVWEDDDGSISRDDVVLFEVMADMFDREWWQHYRSDLEKRFSQDSIVVRIMEIDLL